MAIWPLPMTHGRSRLPAAVKLFPGLVREEFSLVTELLKCMYNNVNIIKDGQLGPDRQFSKLMGRPKMRLLYKNVTVLVFFYIKFRRTNCKFSLSKNILILGERRGGYWIRGLLQVKGGLNSKLR